MAESYPTGKFEADIEELGQLWILLDQNKNRGGQPLNFVEYMVRERTKNLNSAICKNKHLESRLAIFLKKRKLKTQSLLDQLRRRGCVGGRFQQDQFTSHSQQALENGNSVTCLPAKNEEKCKAE